MVFFSGSARCKAHASVVAYKVRFDRRPERPRRLKFAARVKKQVKGEGRSVVTENNHFHISNARLAYHEAPTISVSKPGRLPRCKGFYGNGGSSQETNMRAFFVMCNDHEDYYSLAIHFYFLTPGHWRKVKNKV